jgi:hypothetical protein
MRVKCLREKIVEYDIWVEERDYNDGGFISDQQSRGVHLSGQVEEAFE